jgi:hypothetical protein
MNQKLKKTAFIFLSSIIYFTSCTIGEEPGPLTSEERVISSFDGIQVETVGKVNLHIAQEYKVMIRTNVNVLDDITLSIYDGDLLIKLTGNHKKIDLLEFDVYAPEYTSIKLEGVADIRCDEFLTTPTLNVDQNGVGNIYLADIEVQNAYFKLHEVGDVEVQGIADKIIAIHSGVGNLRMFELSGKEGDLKLSGTGDIEINVSENLKIDLSGVGDIRYMGTPSMTINHHGVGKIIHVK